MEISGDYSTPYVRVTPKYHTRLQGIEPQVGKRRLSQARHRATLAGLFNNLRETVFSQQENSVSKSQVLCQAKNYIQELEQTLENLLKMKEVLNLEDGNPSSLEDVKEEYVKMYFNNHSIIHSSDVLSQNGTTVWYVIQEHEKPIVEEDVSQRLTQSSATSSPDLMEFERSTFTVCASDSQEDNHRLYLQIISFLTNVYFASTQPSQEEILQLDYETVMLRCTETFDDDL